MTNVKEFSDKYYITKPTVADCGEEVWEKFRQYVFDYVTQYGGISENCAEFYNHSTPSCNAVSIDSDRWFMWFSGAPTGQEYTKQDILNILSHHGYIKQEEPTMPKFKAMKFRVKDAEHSAHIQKYLFSLGYKWAEGCVVQYTDCAEVYARENGALSTGVRLAQNKKKVHQEHTLDVHTTITYTCNPIEKPRATIELNGVHYYVDELEKALQHIKPVENA